MHLLIVRDGDENDRICPRSWSALNHRDGPRTVDIFLERIADIAFSVWTIGYLQPTGVRTRGNEIRFLVPFTSVNSYKNSFFPSTLEQSSIRYHKNAIPRGFQGRDCFQLPLDQPQMFLTRLFYPAPVNFCKYTNRPSLTCTVHSKCINDHTLRSDIFLPKCPTNLRVNTL
jgi:hypothetical protein